MTISLDNQIACVNREIAMRKYVYPNQVARGKMTEKQAQEGIATMEAVSYTLQIAKRTHLDKPWNQAPVLSAWLSYPENKPTDDQKYDDFFILYLNPRHINKLGLTHNAPLHLAEVSSWVGDKFLAEGRLTITHYMPIPKLPTEE